MNKVDDFFKKKVDAIDTEPRAEAWAKLEANLSKKNNTLIWVRAAAALLVAGVLLTSIMWLQNKEGEQKMAESKKEIPSETSHGSMPKTDSITQSPQEENKSIAKINKTNKKEKKASEQVTSSQLVKTPEPYVTTNIPVESETIKTETVAAAAVEKSIVIEYTLESIKYLKKDIPVLAETAEKKNSLQKAIDFAREAKNSDSPLGELRQAKDDLFALNFKKDKLKKQ